MKSFRWTFVFALLVAGLVAFSIFDYERTTQKEENKEKDLAIVRLKKDEIQAIEIAAKGDRYRLEKQNGNWLVVSPLQDDGDKGAIDSFLDSLESEKRIETVAEGDGVDLSIYGLKDPVSRLQLKDQAGQTQEIRIGTVKSYDQNLYAQFDEEKKVYLVSSSWDEYLLKPLREFREKKIYRTNQDAEVERLEIRQADSRYPRAMVFEKADGKWKMLEGGEGLPLADGSIHAYIQQVKSAQGLDFLEESKMPASLSKHGLQKPNLIVKMRRKGQKETDFELVLAAPKNKDANNVAGTSSEVGTVMSFYRSTASALQKRPDHFYDKKVPFQFTATDVQKVTIDTPKLKGEFVKKGDNWESTDKNLNKDVDSSILTNLVGKLNRMEAVRFVKPFKPGQKPKFNTESRIFLSHADGKSVLELVWGEKVTEKADESRPEAEYLLARTSLMNHVLGLSEGSINGLELEKVVKEKAPSAATAVPASK